MTTLCCLVFCILPLGELNESMVQPPELDARRAYATIAVYHADTNNLADVFADVTGSTRRANPFLADSRGRWRVFAAGSDDGYDVRVSHRGVRETMRAYPKLGGMFVSEFIEKFGCRKQETVR